VWRISGTPEVHHWLASVLERASGAERSLRTEGYGAAALAAMHMGDHSASRRYAKASLELAREAGDERQIEWGLRALSFTEKGREERRRLLRECERLVVKLGDEHGLGWVTTQLGAAALDEGDYDEAHRYFDRAAEVFRRADRRWEAVNATIGGAHALVAGGAPGARASRPRARSP
jgi:tetratricopeptide (TPR) repeat protein